MEASKKKISEIVVDDKYGISSVAAGNAIKIHDPNTTVFRNGLKIGLVIKKDVTCHRTDLLQMLSF